MSGAESALSAPPVARRADKRRAVIDAAARVFGEAGYERASIDTIAAAAGVSKPTVYAYFGSKELLFRAAMADIARQVNRASYEVLVSLDLDPARWEASLRDLALALTACHREGCGAALSRLVLSESRRDPEVFHEVRRAGVEPILEALAGRLAMLGNAGLLDLPDPGTAAQHFIALTQGRMPELTTGGNIRGDQGQIERAVNDGVDTFLRAYQRR